MKALEIATLASLCAATVAASAHAQDAPIQFRVLPVQGNPVGCTNLDPTLSRVHAITITGDKAVLKSSGGINDTLKQTAPGLYKMTFRLGDVTLEVVADASATPRTLSVQEPKRGCRWSAVAS